MKKFIINLFSNRFGIISAALNLCYFASQGNHVTCNPIGKIFVSMNFPAALSALLSLKFIGIFARPLSIAAETQIANIFFATFIVLQWLVIAWIAKTLAAKIRRPKM